MNQDQEKKQKRCKWCSAIVLGENYERHCSDCDFNGCYQCIEYHRNYILSCLKPAEPQPRLEKCDKAWDIDHPCDLLKGHSGEHKNHYARG